jgi:hypothetical protein
MTEIGAHCRPSASRRPIGSFCQELTFILVDVNDRLWVGCRRGIINLQAGGQSSGDHCGHWIMLMETPGTELPAAKRPVWNAGRSVGAKRALKPKQIWESRFFLNERRRVRDRALFDLAIDSKLPGCDLVRMKVGDIVNGGQVRMRAIVMPQKTSRPVQCELLPDARASLLA